MERSLKTPNNFKYGRTSSLYLKPTIFQSFGGKHLWLISTSSLLSDAARNDYLKQETKEKCQPRKKRKIEGRSATVPLHTHLL